MSLFRKTALFLAATVVALSLFPSESGAAELVGSLPGDLSVDNKGSANYSIPLEVPPGINGLQPNLSVNYSSTSGNGLMGVGFSFSTGLPNSIVRGRTLLARDGVVRGAQFDDSLDRYYLDGKLLICISGTYGVPGSTYRTEVDSFGTITTAGSSSIETFTLVAKDGTEFVFGKGVNVSANGIQKGVPLSGGGDTVAYAWALVKVEDVSGNALNFSYSTTQSSGATTTGEYVLSKIEYASRYSIDLSYSTSREDKRFSYNGGRKFLSHKRLDSVVVSDNQTVLSNYSFTYQVSTENGQTQLQSVGASFRDSSGAFKSISPTLFDWSSYTAVSSVNATNSGTLPGYSPPHSSYQGHAIGDFDNDGKVDIAAISSSGSVANLKLSRFERPEIPNPSAATVAGRYGSFQTSSTTISGNTGSQIGLLTADLDGDGKTSIIYCYNPTTQNGRPVIWGGGLSYTVPLSWFSPTSGGGDLDEQRRKVKGGLFGRFIPGDFDGDGKDEILVHGYDGKHHILEQVGSTLQASSLAMNGSQVGTQPYGFTYLNPHLLSAAYADVLDLQPDYHTEYIYQRWNPFPMDVSPMPADLNGDGALDYLWIAKQLNVSIATNSDGAHSAYRKLFGSFSNGTAPGHSYPDTELILAQSGSNGFYATNGNIPNSWDGVNLMSQILKVGDVNGDGLSDVVQYDPHSSGGGAWKVLTATGAKNSMLATSTALSGTFTSPIDGQTLYTYGRFMSRSTYNSRYGTGLKAPQYYGGELAQLQSETSGNTFLMDLNHDGLSDLVWFVQYKKAPSDWNGTEATEVASSANVGWWVSYSNGSSFSSSPQKLSGGIWNQFDTNSQNSILNAGYTLEITSPWGVGHGITTPTIQQADINGDGVPDWLLGSRGPNDVTSLPEKFVISPGEIGGLVTAITNGIGKVTAIQYKGGKDDTIYTRGPATVYPIQESRYSGPLVSDVFKDTGSSQPARYAYQYSGRYSDVSGRGDLGYHSFVTYDHQTDLLSYQFLTQSFPMTGLVKREQVFRAFNVQKDGNGNVTNFDLLPISSQDNDVTFDEVNIPGKGLKGTVYPFMSHSQKLSWEDQAATPLTVEVESPESLFYSYNEHYAENKQYAHSRINTHVWFDDQPQGVDPPTELPLGYDDQSSYVPGQQDATAVGFTTWNAQLDLIQGAAGSAHGDITYGNVRRTRVDYGDGFVSDSIVNYHAPSAYTVGLSGLVSTSQTIAKTPTDPDGQGSPVSTYTYHSATGLVKTELTNAGASGVFKANGDLNTTKTYTYNTRGQLEKTEVEGSSEVGDYYVGPKRILSQVTEWDPTNRFPQKTVNAYGHWTRNEYDAYGRVKKVNDINDSDTSNGGTVTTYDAIGRPLTSTDRLRGNTSTTTLTKYTTTPFSVAGPAGAGGLTLPVIYKEVSKSGFSGNANLGATVTTYFDRLGRAVRTEKQGYQGQLAITDTVYDIAGRVVAVSNPYPSGTSAGSIPWTITKYDDLGRAYHITAPNGTITTTKYFGRVTQVTVDAPLLNGVNPAPQTTTTLVNAKGDTVKVWNADNVPSSLQLTRVDQTASLQYILDGFGRMIRTVAWQGSDRPSGVPEFLTVRTEYDAIGNQTRLDDPDKGVWDYVYNGLGQLAWQSDPRGGTVTTKYDVLGRPLARYTRQSDNSETATWTYYDTVNDAVSGRVNDNNNGWIGSVQKETVLTTDSRWAENDNKLSQNAYYYDDKGNLVTALNMIDDKWMYRNLRYDSLNRVQDLDYYWRPAGFEDEPQAFPENWRRYGVRNYYDDSGTSPTGGYLVKVTAGHETDTSKNPDPSQYDTWWEVGAGTTGYDFLDRPNVFRKGNGHWTDRDYDLVTGVLATVKTGSSNSIQNDTYLYDGLGNLYSRKNRLNKTETFTYDVLNRLTASTVGGTVRTNAYYANGSIKTKQSVAGTASGTYGYDSDQPHAVATAFGYSLDYDESGNVKTRTGNGETWAFRWNAFDKPHWMGREKTSSPTSGSAFRYGVDRMRIVHYEFDSFDKSAGSSPADWKPGHYTKKKLYIGEGSMEYDYENTAPAGATPSWRVARYRLYVNGGDGKAGAVEIDPLKVDASAYIGQVYHYDHLGSIAAITDYGSTTASYGDDKTGKDSLYSYDSWGQRRDPSDWVGAADSQSTYSRGASDDWATRGYTGHEMLDDLGLIHMNGRIYDPLLGRFLSADAIVDGASSLQGYNRYAYLKNNPLNATDPTGYWSKQTILRVMAADTSGTGERILNSLKSGDLKIRNYEKIAFQGVIQEVDQSGKIVDTRIGNDIILNSVDRESGRMSGPAATPGHSANYNSIYLNDQLSSDSDVAKKIIDEFGHLEQGSSNVNTLKQNEIDNTANTEGVVDSINSNIKNNGIKGVPKLTAEYRDNNGSVSLSKIQQAKFPSKYKDSRVRDGYSGKGGKKLKSGNQERIRRGKVIEAKSKYEEVKFTKKDFENLEEWKKKNGL